nr:helix-turn-helix domain-containing protein [Cohnella thermotolerans]
MNVLVVDDDYFVVKALEQKIDWKSLAIEEVYSAYNVSQAREILRRYSVHVLICDIEMPQGSGLELLAWIREEHYAVQAIFLTNYADFNYAQKAIELQSFDYFLKPIEFDKLTLIIQKAAAKANEQRLKEEAVRSGYLWEKNRNKLAEHFWRKLIAERAVPPGPAAIAGWIADDHLSYEMTDGFRPLLINMYPGDRSLAGKDKDLFDYSFLNVLTELLRDCSITVETVLEYKDFNWVAILRWSEGAESSSIESACASFIDRANQYLKCDVCCSVAVPCRLDAIHQVFRQSVDMNDELIKRRNRIYFLDGLRQPEAVYVPPDLARLEEWLVRNEPAAFLRATSDYLHGLARTGGLNASVLRLFRLDIVQLVYAFLKEREIQAHRLYQGRLNDQLFMRSLNSLEDMEQYLDYLVRTAAEHRSFTDRPGSVVERIKRYVRDHCGDDLTRTGLAEVVYLNPDYLARLFKKETGVSLGTYIIQTRIKTAKHLLESTNLAVTTIARKVGYSNDSHFSKFFKQNVGATPHEFRKARQQPRAT